MVEIVVPGCPVVESGYECIRGCGGWHPISTEDFTAAVVKNEVDPDNLCGPLTIRVKKALALLAPQASSQ